MGDHDVKQAEFQNEDKPHEISKVQVGSKDILDDTMGDIIETDKPAKKEQATAKPDES